MKYPDFEDLDEPTKEYIHRQLGRFENIISTPDYEELIDVDSFCRWLIAQDIMGTSDGGGTNFYLAKNDDEESSKLYIPVLWDLDSGEQSRGQWSAVHDESMIEPLFNNANVAFKRRYCELYRELSPAIFEKMDSLANELAAGGDSGWTNAVSLDSERWSSEESVYTNTRNAQDMKQWFPQRKRWLDAEVEKIEKYLAGTDRIEADEDSSVEVYTIAGLKVYSGPADGFAPSSPGLYIIKSSTSSQKLLFP